MLGLEFRAGLGDRQCQTGIIQGYIGIMEKKMETTIIYYIGLCGGNIRVILGLYRDNGKEHGNYRDYRGYIGIVLGLYIYP